MTPFVHLFSFFFFLNETPTTEISSLPPHAALPIYYKRRTRQDLTDRTQFANEELLRKLLPLRDNLQRALEIVPKRSEEHTSELQSHLNLVCRLLLEKKNLKTVINNYS